MFELLRRPAVRWADLRSLEAQVLGARGKGSAACPETDAVPDAKVSRETENDLDEAVIEQVEISAKYAGYITRQQEDIERAAHHARMQLPPDIDYTGVSALSIEVRQTLQKHRPETLGQASRISGVTPAAVSLLMIHLKKGGFKGFAVAQVQA